MKDIGLPELTPKQMEQLCTTAEEAARKYILSRVPTKDLTKLSIVAEAEGARPTSLEVDVDIALVRSKKSLDAQELASEAMNKAFESAENFLRELACHTQK